MDEFPVTRLQRTPETQGARRAAISCESMLRAPGGQRDP